MATDAERKKNMTRTTNRTALEYVLNNCTMPDEIREKVVAMLQAIERRSQVERKPTAKQTANAAVRSALVDFINTYGQDGTLTVTDLINKCDVVNGKSHQYVTAILRQAWLNREISKRLVKRTAYFIPHDPSLDYMLEEEEADE